MTITLPIYVRTVDAADGQGRAYEVRPLFHSAPARRDPSLERALSLLATDLRKHLRELGRRDRHDELAEWAFCPEIESRRVDLVIELRRSRAKARFLVASFEALGRRLAFTPSVPGAWFEVARGERLEARAVEVLTEYFRTREREDEDGFVGPAELSIAGKAWVSSLTIDEVQTGRVPPSKEEDTRRAALGRQAVLEGQGELERVGRCLDRLYPDDLDRAIGRDREVAELARLLGAGDRRPVLVLGPRLVGKTTLIHEHVFRTVAGRKNPYRARENVWLLAPQRLISGMSFVGQWEDRLLSILRAAEERRHVLYFDDLLGLFHAGQSRCSNLSMAQVLRSHLERRGVRILAELTPEAFRVLRERDRGLADLFHVLPLDPPAEPDNLRILVGALRHLEGRHRCRFGTDVLPVVLDLQRRYAREAEFPGKAVAYLKRLAVKYQDVDVKYPQVIDEFHAQTGLAVTFLDARKRLEREEIVEALRRDVVGQEAALEAAADVLGIAKARLNDPDRPLGSLLFLGPTGVGKTQCAKALARYLFGDPGRLLRFDLNEFGAPGSAVRLVGTFAEPEGLLTGAVRRRPFAVVLLDEVEKAHPEVFDVLLQVLGEGRLTDALGRTVDFGNTLIVLTSNLGVRQAESSLGFGRDDRTDDVYRRAAEAFFRPEFFNRLDRIVPFRRLGRDDLRAIARQVIGDVFAREGLARRRCLLAVEDRALDHLAELGCRPSQGARALKRAVEHHLTRPVAARLATADPEATAVLSVHPGPDGLAVRMQSLSEVAPTPRPEIAPRDRSAVVARVASAARRIEREFAPMRREAVIDPSRIDGPHYRYFAVREQARRVLELARSVAERLDAARARPRRVPVFPFGNLLGSLHDARLRWHHGGDFPWRNVAREQAAADDIHAYVREAVATAPNGPTLDAPLADLLGQAALLRAIAEAARAGTVDRVLLYVRPLNPTQAPRAVHHAVLASGAFGSGMEVEATLLQEGAGSVRDVGLVLHGPHATTLARVEMGTHLVRPAHEPAVVLQVVAIPLPDGADARATLDALVESRRDWQDRLEAGRAGWDEDPFPLGPVVRVYDEPGLIRDLRTGRAIRSPLKADALRALILEALPLPEELAPESW